MTEQHITNTLKGVIMAGGTGSRLGPATKVVSKHLLPVFDKPMIYYPLSLFFLIGIRDILIIVNKTDLDDYVSILGSGERFGVNLIYKTQNGPKGIADGFAIAEEFIEGSQCLFALGDNIFIGNDFVKTLQNAISCNQGATMFLQEVADASQFGVVKFDENGDLTEIIEKPLSASHADAITGLYIFDSNVVEFASHSSPSKRGELEITDVLSSYMLRKKLNYQKLGRGFLWFDAGTPQDLLEVSAVIKSTEDRLGIQIGAIDLIAFQNGWIDKVELEKNLESLRNCEYGMRLRHSITNKIR
jgi:glucose-1-phosphate thymidylyltransferase